MHALVNHRSMVIVIFLTVFQERRKVTCEVSPLVFNKLLAIFTFRLTPLFKTFLIQFIDFILFFGIREDEISFEDIKKVGEVM